MGGGLSDRTKFEDLVQFGYLLTQETLKTVPKPDKSLKIKLDGVGFVPIHRHPVAVPLPYFHPLTVLPRPERFDKLGTVASLAKRVGCDATAKSTQAREKVLADFGIFVDKWLVGNLVPLSPDVDTSVETFLEGTNYSRKEKVALLEKWDKMVNPECRALDDPKWRNVREFIKEEPYMETKTPRGIFPRADEFKLLVGPITKLIEKAVFALDCFIKKVPVRDRPKMVVDLLCSYVKVYQTDFTSFESGFTAEFMEQCEMKLFRYMTQKLPGGADYYERVAQQMAKQNLQNRSAGIIASLVAKRMSGDQWTSLCNGFSNLMLVLFITDGTAVGVFEGDDGLFGSKVIPKVELLAELGFVVKLVEVDDVGKASFCGIICDRNSHVVVTDPLKVVASFGWVSAAYSGFNRKKKMMLLRSRGISLAYQYPGAPVISAVARLILKLTSGINISRAVIDQMDSYKKDVFLEAVKSDYRRLAAVPVEAQTRDLVHELFGIDPESQIIAEQACDQAQGSFPFLESLAPFYTDRVFRVWEEDVFAQVIKVSSTPNVGTGYADEELKMSSFVIAPRQVRYEALVNWAMWGALLRK